MPGIRWGEHPERRQALPADPLQQALARWWPDTGHELQARVAAVRQEIQALQHLSPDGLQAQFAAVQRQLIQEGLTRPAIHHACAFVAHAAHRSLGLAAYDPQLLATLAILDNRLAEMATGEGKSLAAAMAAGVAALAGVPVHVLTANDYLVARDAERFAPLFSTLKLSVASVLAGQAPEARRRAYARDIVYVTARELVFDYLRDRLQTGAGTASLRRRASSLVSAEPTRPLLRGLCMAVVDEADSILIDEAQMPLVLSRPADDAHQRAFLWQAHALAQRLVEGDDFECLPAERRVELTPAGRRHIEHLAAPLQPAWKNRQHRDEVITHALAARHVFQRDRDYVVADGAIDIVDPVTGRTTPGRVWSRGLHALVALKEGCRAEPEVEVLAQITYQRYFRRYLRFGGLSGTLREARHELARLYGARVVSVPLHRRSQRVPLPGRLFIDDHARWQAVVARTRALQQQGRPVLIGCDSVADTQALSLRLQAAGIEHAVLNAHCDASERQIVADAGQAGRVTVATQMAGRGTDIELDALALAAGGLHVLSCQLNDARRHDRQLAGRAGRQGEPGSCETWSSWQTLQRVDGAAGGPLAWLGRRLMRHLPLRHGEIQLPGWLLAGWLNLRQRRIEQRQARQRHRMLRQDSAMEQGLSFSDRLE
jgi:preprotein translocase subunit SecA